MLWIIDFHLHQIGGDGGVAPDDLQKSFVLDSVYSGVTRCGTSAVTFTTIYGLLDPGGSVGNRRITTRQLPRFAALLRAAFPRTRLIDVRREIAITMTTVEWAMLIRSFGDRVDGRLALKENVHYEIIEGRIPQPGKKRNLSLIQLLPGVWSTFLSHFVRIDAGSRNAAAASIGPSLAVQHEQPT
jgi:hypothetical protein